MELRRLIREYSNNDENVFALYMNSLKSSVLTAFYTDNRIVDAISDALKYSGIEIKSFLEPSAGQGAFIDSFLRNDRYPGSEVLSFEKDLITGKILQALHPSTTVNIEGFERIDPDFNGYFDVAASNVPFGDFAVTDPGICREQGDCVSSGYQVDTQLFLPQNSRSSARGQFGCFHRVSGCVERRFAIR